MTGNSELDIRYSKRLTASRQQPNINLGHSGGVSSQRPNDGQKESTEVSSPTLSNVMPLNDSKINEEIKRTSAGVYALDATSSGPFTYSYVGRSDTDLNKRLHDWIGKYKYFKYAYCTSAKDAFEAECNLYHDHKPPDNSVHPARPEDAGWKCPRCRIFD